MTGFFSKNDKLENWNPYGTPPDGIRLLNLRNANINSILLYIEPKSFSRSLRRMLGLTAADAPWVIRLQSGAIKVVTKSGLLSRPRETQFSFPNVKNISIPSRRQGGQQYLQIEGRAETISLGHGLSAEALEWLKNYLIIIVAGLTWKPIGKEGRLNIHNDINYATNPILLKSDLAIRLIDIFLSDVDQKVERLIHSVDGQDVDGIRKQAHWLKSASANVGAWHICELAQKLEKNAIDKNLSQAKSLSSEIESTLPEFKTWLTDVQKTAAVMISHKANEDGDTATVSLGQKEEPQRKRHSARVLVVDDSAVSREVAIEFLNDMVDEVVCASDGREAIEKWKSQPFDLIFMDSEMTKMNGIEATKEIRSQEQNTGQKRIPIVGLTGNIHNDQKQTAFDAGMDDYIEKPYTPENLEKALTEWIKPDQEKAENDQPSVKPHEVVELQAGEEGVAATAE